jgi:prepilin-type processing-associated H-X9-DG protein
MHCKAWQPFTACQVTAIFQPYPMKVAFSPACASTLRRQVPLPVGHAHSLPAEPAGLIARQLLRRSHPSRVAAFTLIELFVTVTIIGLLAALVFPAVQGAMDSSKASRCMSNLRQIGSAFLSYAGDHDAELPMLNPEGPFPNSQWYVNQLSRYLPVAEWRYQGGEVWGDTDKGVYRCPAATEFAYGGGYGVNESHIVMIGRPVRLTQLEQPNRLWLIGDACDAGQSKRPTWAGVRCPQDNPWGKEHEADARHKGHANVCFVDGHVEAWLYEDLKANKNDIFAHQFVYE